MVVGERESPATIQHYFTTGYIARYQSSTIPPYIQSAVVYEPRAHERISGELEIIAVTVKIYHPFGVINSCIGG